MFVKYLVKTQDTNKNISKEFGEDAKFCKKKVYNAKGGEYFVKIFGR